MAEYDVVPKRLSLGEVTGKALVLSDISCKTTVFPPRRIFQILSDIQFGQLNPSIAGINIGGRVTTVTPVGGVGPFVITIDPNDDDDDDEDYVVVDDDITWDVTPDDDCRTITVRVTDAYGDFTTKEITICGKLCYSDNFNDNSLDVKIWSVVASVGNGGSIVETGSAWVSTALAGLGQTNGYGRSNSISIAGDFTTSVDFSNWVDSATGTSFSQLTATVGGSSLSIGRVNAGEDGFESVDGVATTSVANSATSGSLRIKRVGDTISLDYNDGTGWTTLDTVVNTGTVTATGLTTSGNNNPTNISVTFDNFVLQSPNGTPYCT